VREYRVDRSIRDCDMKERRKPGIDRGGTEDATSVAPRLDLIAQQLNAAYQDLHDKVADMNLQLGQTNLELRQALAEKDRMSNYLSGILESLSQGVVAVDLSGSIAAFNLAAAKILGLKAKDVLGKSYREVFGREADEKFGLPYLLKTGRTCSDGQKQIEKEDGVKVTLSFSNALLKDTQGEVFGAMEVFSPKPESKEPAENLAHVKTLAAVGEMAAVVAHEIKNPLGGIRGFAELLDRDLEEGDPRKKSLAKIIQGVEALSKILATLLDQVKPVELDLKRVEMVGFTEEALKFFAMDPANQKPNIRMVKSYPQEQLHCSLDAEQFRRTLLNLFHNAVQAMPNGGQMKIELSRGGESSACPSRADERKAVLEISDTGIGMSSEVQKKIFTPFFTTKEGGTGLGLFTVKKIVEAHAGEIRLESRPGKGTTVRLILPMSK
jgi:PAS domain S-box-containing protein